MVRIKQVFHFNSVRINKVPLIVGVYNIYTLLTHLIGSNMFLSLMQTEGVPVGGATFMVISGG